MFVQTEITPNPNSLKFLPGKRVSNKGSFEITQKDQTNNELVKNLLGVNIFETEEYEINFSSNNINLVKENKINEIKIKSFQNQFKKILTNKNLKKIQLNDINFISL